MNRFLLSTGALFYLGAVAVALTSFAVDIPATTILLPLVLLTGLGIATTANGVEARGPIGSRSADSLMASGSVLGTLWLFVWGVSEWSYAHTMDVCEYSKIVPSDPYAQWACPQVEATYYVLWTLTLGLLTPSLLFLTGLYLAIRHRHRSRETKESP